MTSELFTAASLHTAFVVTHLDSMDNDIVNLCRRYSLNDTVTDTNCLFQPTKTYTIPSLNATLTCTDCFSQQRHHHVSLRHFNIHCFSQKRHHHVSLSDTLTYTVSANNDTITSVYDTLTYTDCFSQQRHHHVSQRDCLCQPTMTSSRLSTTL